MTVLVPPQRFRKTEGIHRVGLAADRPAAADVLIGTLYFSSDTGVLERSNGTAWEPYAGSGGGGGVPSPHHATHEVGGSDQVQHVAWTNQANTFTKNQIIDGTVPDYARFFINDHTGEGAVLVLSDLTAPADRRTFFFKSQGGGFSIQAIDASGATTGSVQFVTGAMILRTPLTPQLLMGNLTDSALDYPRLIAGAGQMEFKRFDNTGRILVLAKGFGDTPLDASQLLSGTVPLARLPAIPVAAHHTTHEAGGTDELLIGRWTDVPFNAANFLTNTGTWTVDATAVLANRYTRLGNLLIWQLYISWTTGTSVVAGSPTLLGVTAPGGVTFLPNAYQTAAVVVDGGARTETTTDVAAVTTYFTVGHKNNSSFAAGPVGFVATMTWGIV